jgi:hypothetical protein
MAMVLGIDIGLVNFSYCFLSMKGRGVRAWDTVNLLSLCGMSIQCSKVTPADLHSIAEVVFPSIFGDLSGVRHVAIEQQPHGKYANTKMIVLSHLTLAYFRRLARDPASPVVTARMVPPGQKYNQGFLASTGLPVKKRKYADRKLLGVQLAHAIGPRLGVDMSRMDCSHKKDDLADSFLLAYVELLTWSDLYGVNTGSGAEEEEDI